MRRIVIVSALSLAVAGVASAQQAVPPGKAAAEKGPGAQPAPRVVVQPGQVVQSGQVQPGQPVAQGQAGQNAQWQNKDQTIAECVGLDNQTEITIVKAAREKLQSEKAKDFADMLVKDHQAFLAKLQKIAPSAGKENLESAGERDNRTSSREGQPAAGRQTTAFRGDPNAGLDFMQIHREMAQECIAAAEKGMSEKKDSEIDACFVGWQIASHGMMKTKLTVLERHASGELAQVLKEGRETTEKHMKEAEKLMDQLAAHHKPTKEDRQAVREDAKHERQDAKSDRVDKREERRDEKSDK